jgi:SAM-dependent methyltransferase
MTPQPRSNASAHGYSWGSAAEDWAAIQEPQFRPAYEEVFRRIPVGPGVRYLDVGCGAGLAALMAASRGAEVAGLDASENMLSVARRRVPSGEFHHGEMEHLPFPDSSFDLVTGFNSFQFAANPVVALREARRVAKPGEPVAITTLGRPEGMEAATLIAALSPLLPPPPPGSPGPFALSDDTALREFVTTAGLTPVETFEVSCPWHFPDLETGIRGLCASGSAARARAHVGPAAVEEAYRQALANFRQSDGTCRVGATFRCLLAKA